MNHPKPVVKVYDTKTMFAALWSKEVKVNILLVSMHIKYILAAAGVSLANTIVGNERCYILNSVPNSIRVLW